MIAMLPNNVYCTYWSGHKPLLESAWPSTVPRYNLQQLCQLLRGSFRPNARERYLDAAPCTTLEADHSPLFTSPRVLFKRRPLQALQLDPPPLLINSLAHGDWAQARYWGYGRRGFSQQA